MPRSCSQHICLVLAERSFQQQYVPAEEASARAVSANCILLRPNMLKERLLSWKTLAGTKNGLAEQPRRCVVESTKFEFAAQVLCSLAAFALLGRGGTRLYLPIKILYRRNVNQ